MRRTASHACITAVLIAGLSIESASAAEPLRAAIRTCQTRLDAQIDVGYARIASRCPELVRLLASSEWQEWLPRSWREAGNDLSVGGLEELATLIERERAREPTGRRPGTAKLHEVLEGLESAQARRGGPWERVRQWLETVLERAPDDEPSGWLERLLRRGPVSQIVIETITYIAVALVVALAALVVANELRVAGAFRRRRSGGERPVTIERRAVPRVTRRQIEQASLQERPGLLLRLIFERLAQAGRLPRAATLTVREAQALAALPDASDRERLAELSAAAEHVRYAAVPASAGLLSRAVDAGAALLATLDAASARPS